MRTTSDEPSQQLAEGGRIMVCAPFRDNLPTDKRDNDATGESLRGFYPDDRSRRTSFVDDKGEAGNAQGFRFNDDAALHRSGDEQTPCVVIRTEGTNHPSANSKHLVVGVKAMAPNRARTCEAFPLLSEALDGRDGHKVHDLLRSWYAAYRMKVSPTDAEALVVTVSALKEEESAGRLIFRCQNRGEARDEPSRSFDRFPNPQGPTRRHSCRRSRRLHYLSTN
jgi:hypothetical protein